MGVLGKLSSILFGKFQTRKNKIKWKERNMHNLSTYGRVGYIDNVSVGNWTYGEIYMQMSRPICKVKIGSFCSIAKNVFFIPCSDHPIDQLSTYPFKTMFGKSNCDAITNGDILIDDDVWIGYGATILSGVHIGQGAVVAAGAVVSKDVPPYAVVGGVPAKVLKYRFDRNVIDYFLTFDYSKVNQKLISSHMDSLYYKLDIMSLEEIKTLFDWFPKR